MAISKELYEAVTGYRDDLIDIAICGKTIGYPGHNVNIYELMHMCKEWAWNNGYELASFKANHSGSWFCTIRIIDIITNKITFITSTEPEAVFKTCQWVLDNKDEL